MTFFWCTSQKVQKVLPVCKHQLNKLINYMLFKITTNLWTSSAARKASHAVHRVVKLLGLFTVAIYRPFLLHFHFSFFFHFSKMNSKMNMRMSWRWSFLEKWTIPPPFCKNSHFHFHFAFIFTYHFCHSLKLLLPIIGINLSLTPPLLWPVHIDSMTLPLPPSTLFCQHNSVTTCHHHSHTHYQACTSHEWPAQMMVTHCLGSRVYFFLFISSFYKLTNHNHSFLGSILLVMTGTDAAQPTPTPTHTHLHYPSSPFKWDVRGLG